MNSKLLKQRQKLKLKRINASKARLIPGAMDSVRTIEGAHLARSANPQRDYQRREPGAVRRQIGAIVHAAAEAAVDGMAPLAGGAAPRQLRHLFPALALPRMASTRSPAPTGPQRRRPPRGRCSGPAPPAARRPARATWPAAPQAPRGWSSGGGDAVAE